MNLRSKERRWLAGIAVLCCFVDLGLGQEGTWSVSLGGGPAFPSLSEVNKTLDETVSDWNQRQVPISALDHFSPVIQFSIRGMYRYDRDMAASLAVSHFSQSISGEYEDSSISLMIDRSVGAMEIAFGLSYFFPPLIFDTEIGVSVDAGIFLARGGATTYNLGKRKIGATEVDTLIVDTDAQYRKSKLVASIGGMIIVHVYDPLFFRLDAAFKLAAIGRMPGTVRRIEGTFEEESFSNFNFSGFSFSVGAGITL